MFRSPWVFQGLFHSARDSKHLGTASLSHMELHGSAQPLVPALLLVGRQPLSLPHWALCQYVRVGMCQPKAVELLDSGVLMVEPGYYSQIAIGFCASRPHPHNCVTSYEWI